MYQLVPEDIGVQEYLTGGFNGIEYIRVEKREDGTVLYQRNDFFREFGTRDEYREWLEENYRAYSESLDQPTLAERFFRLIGRIVLAYRR